MTPQRNTVPAKNLRAEDDPDVPDRVLIPLVKQGIRWASDRLVRRYYARARALAVQMCDGNSNEAQDLTQEAFLNALRHIGSFEERASFKTWFYRIIINTCRDARRRRRRWFGIFRFPRSKPQDGETAPMTPDAFPDEAEDSDPAASVSVHRLREDIEKALGELPEKQQMVFRLKVIEDLSIAEIADISALSPGTIKSHLFRATRRMRKALAGWSKKEST